MKLLIVDDEIQIREGMKDGIDWGKLGIRKVDDADGYSAWNLFQKEKHEIVLVDIRMPGMDGIELSKRIMDLQPETRIMILSGYSDFKYAQSAIKIGVVNYELKPVNADKVIHFVRQSVQILEQSNIRNQQHLQYQKLSKNNLLKSLLSGNAIPDAAIKFEEYFGFSLSDPVQCILAVSNRNIPDTPQNRWDTIAASVFEECKCAIYQGTEHDTLVIYRVDLTPKGLREYTSIWKKRLAATVNDDLLITVSHAGCAKKLPELYHQCRQLQSCRLYDTTLSILYCDDMETVPHVMQFPFKEKKEFYHSIEEKNGYSAERMIENAFHEMQEKKCYSVQAVQMFCKEAIETVKLALVDSLAISDNALFTNLPQELDYYKEYLLKYCKCLIDHSTVSLKNSYHTAVLQVIDYLKCNYEQPVTLEQMAKMADKTPNYFSVLFKNSTGQPFHKYLTSLRIDMAKKLICESSLKVYEISAKVGFQDYKYFAKVFYDLEGCSISEYRRRKTQHQKIK
ncbi:MAG: response regulator [Clostridiales bacterium]|nr:response regulator [Clostridiales bacterium]MDU3239886.1 response regulator [Clostridiales bacterium]